MPWPRLGLWRDVHSHLAAVQLQSTIWRNWGNEGPGIGWLRLLLFTTKALRKHQSINNVGQTTHGISIACVGCLTARSLPFLCQHGLVAEIFDGRDTILRLLFHQCLHASDGLSELRLPCAPQDGHQPKARRGGGLKVFRKPPTRNKRSLPYQKGAWLDNAEKTGTLGSVSTVQLQNSADSSRAPNLRYLGFHTDPS